jgi:hypothetical protein
MNKSLLAVPFLFLGVVPTPRAADHLTNCLQTVPIFMTAAFSESGNLLFGSYLAGRSSPFTNASSFVEYRNCLAFALPAFSAPLQSAELRLRQFKTTSKDASETWQLHQVTNDLGLVFSGTSSDAVFADLGDGLVLGSIDITNDFSPINGPDSGRLVGVPLNAAALAAMTSAQGTYFLLGGKVTTLGGNASEREALFDGSYAFGDAPPELILNFGEAEPQVAPPEVDGGDTSLLSGQPLTLVGNACGIGLSYQWLHNSAPVPGATNAVFSRGNAIVAHSGTYSFRVSNASSVVTSEPLVITVSAFEVFQDLVPATAYLEEPFFVFFGATSFLPATAEWHKDGVLLAGQTNTYLSIDSVTTQHGGDYQVIVRNADGAVTSSVARVTVIARPPWVSSLQSNLFVTAGWPWSMLVFANGRDPLSYQWFKDNVPIPGAISNALYYPSAQVSHSGQYYVVVSDSAGSATSTVAQVTVSPFGYVNGPYDTETLWGNPTSLESVVFSAEPVHYRWYFNGTFLPGRTNYQIAFAYPTPADAGQYFFVASNIHGSATSRVATFTVKAQAPLIGAYVGLSENYPNVAPPEYQLGTRLLFYSLGSAGPPAALQWQRDGIDLPGQTNSSIDIHSLSLNDTGDYTIVATNIIGAATSAVIRVTVVARPPVFGWTPGVSNAVAGSTVVLRCGAIGGSPIQFEWRHNGIALPGETNADLFLPSLTTNDSGAYEVIARSLAGESRATNALAVRPANPLDHWHWRRPSPQGSRLYDMAWGDGRYVAVGRAGNIITSTNGLDWTTITLEVDCELRTVTWGNGQFVAVGYIYSPVQSTPYSAYVSPYYYGIAGIVMTSPDGLHWTPGAVPLGANLEDLAFGNGVFVLANYDGWHSFVHISTDGRHWTTVNNAGAIAYRVAFGAGRFVAFSGGGVYYASTNGADWSRIIASNYGVRGLTYGNGRFIETSSGYNGRKYGVMHTSVDGVAWEQYPVTNCYAQMFFGAGGRFFGICQDTKGSLVTSVDGVSWTAIDTGANQELEAGLHAAGQYFIVGEAGTLVRSMDGLAWDLHSTANQIDYYGIAHNGSLLVAAGDSGTILTSTDGRDWTPRATSSSRNLHALAHANDLFVATGRRGAILTSPNGIAWTQRTSNVTNYLERTTFANGLWVAVAEHGDMATSANGFDWTPLNTGVPYSDHEGVAFGNGVWVAVGGYFVGPGENNAVTSIYTSLDGQAWQRVPFDAGKRLRDVAFADGRFVAVGNDGLVVVSADGTSWNTYYLRNPVGEANLRRVHYAHGRFVAVGNDGFVVSSVNPIGPDFWTTHRSNTSMNLHDVMASPDGTFVAVGNNGMILQSDNVRPRLVQLRPVEAGWELEFDAGFPVASLRLEASANLQTWDTIATNITSPITIPATDSHHRFFRLAAP